MENYVFHSGPNYLRFKPKLKKGRKKALIRHFVKQHRDEINLAILPIIGISLITMNKVPLVIKFVYSLVLFLSILLLLYQVYARISYYFEYNVAVDVVQISEEFEHPAFLGIRYDSLAMIDLWNRSKLIKEQGLVNWDCLNPMLTILITKNKQANITLTEIWDATSATSSSTFKVTQKQNKSNFMVMQDEIQTELGIATRFYFVNPWSSSYEGSSLEIKFKKENVDFCIEHSHVVLSKTFTGRDAKTSVHMTRGIEKRVSFNYIKYSFVDTHTSRCVSLEEHINCFRNCYEEKLTQLNCSFPFAKSEVHLRLPPCKNDEKIGQTFTKLLRIYHTTDEYNECHCIKPCEDYAFEPIIETTKSKSIDIATFIFYFRGKELTAYFERLTYDAINLLAEIGGALGLTMGLSILSLIQCLIFVISICQQLNRSKSRKLYLLKKKILRIEKKLRYIKKSDSSLSLNYLRFVIVCSLIVLTIFMLYHCTALFIYEPTAMSIDIIPLAVVQFPTVTLCGAMNSKLFKLKLKANNNRKEGCENISHLQLINDKTSADLIWDLLEFHGSVDIGKSIERYIGLSFDFNFTKTAIPLLFGNCTQIKTEAKPYQGAISFLPLEIMPYEKFSFCDGNVYWYILNFPDESLDLTSAMDMQGASRSDDHVAIKKITRANITRSKCVEKNIHLQCVKDCLKEKSQHQLTCRLPYMNKSDFNVSMCTNYESAIKSQQKYIEIYLRSDAYSICNCLPSCTKTVLKSAVKTATHDARLISVIVINLLNNYIEQLTEVKRYTRDAFISEIGSILGIGLGLSILSIFKVAVGYWSK